MRARRAAAISVAFLVALTTVSAVTAPSSRAADPTKVSLTVVSAQPAGVNSTVTFRAVVAPAGATGSVAFTIDERQLATVALSGGAATTSVRIPRAGQYIVRAAFTPAAGSSGFVRASSANTVLAVGAVARLTIQDSSGRPIPVDTPIAGGTSVRLVAQGFASRTKLVFTIGSASLPGSATTDSKGAATFATKIPGLDAREYLVVAYGGQATAVASLIVDGVVPGATPTPTFCPVSSPPITDSASPTVTSPKPTSGSPRPTKTTRRPTESDKPTSTRSGSATRSDDDDGPGDLPGTGGNLPGTGAAVLSLVLLAGLAFALGTGLISVGRRRPTGRHTR
jgi:hypothetical protein